MKYLKSFLWLPVMILVLANASLAENQYFLDFDGSDDYVRYADDATLGLMDGATDYTIEAWIYPLSSRVAEYDRVLQRYYSFSIQMYDGNNDGNVEDWYFVVIDGSGNKHYFNTEGDATLTLDAWNHIAVICNSSDGTLKLYVNGTDVTQSGGYSNYTLRSSHSSDNLYIGEKGNGSSFFGGYIDEVRIKNVAENINDIHYHKNDPEYVSDNNTAVLFHFDEGTGQYTKNDASNSDARLGSTDAGDAAEPTWRPWNYNGSDLSLPVELTTFTAIANPTNVLLHWSTASEVDNLGFMIERSMLREGPYQMLASYQTDSALKGAGNASRDQNYTYTDFTVLPGYEYWYRLQDVDNTGTHQIHDPIVVTVPLENNELQPVSRASIPKKFKLYSNYPNPFNPETQITFDVPQSKDGPVALKIRVYDVSGKKSVTLYEGTPDAGQYRLRWDGTNDLGQKMGSGIYILQLQSPTFNSSIKMMLIR